MATIAELVKELYGQEVSIDTRTTNATYTGVLSAVDLTPLSSGNGPTAVLRDDEGNLLFVFDVSALAPASATEEEEEDEDEEEEEEEDDDDDDDDD